MIFPTNQLICLSSCSSPPLLYVQPILTIAYSFFLLFLAVRTGGEAELTWYDPEGEEISEDSEPYREERVDELSKWLKITLSEPERGGIFQCKGDFDGEIATTQIRIRVIRM